MDALSRDWNRLKEFIMLVPEDKEEYAYAPGKWTVKQVIHHLIDTERIMSYRALRFARRDPQQPLPFEENDYAANAELDGRSLKDLLDEFESVRKATISLFRSFSDKTLLQSGQTFMGPTTVLALGYLICGHSKHHCNVIAERYLKEYSAN